MGQVGEATNISGETAKQYLDRVRKKYVSAGVEVRNKIDLARIAWREGFLEP